MLRNGAGIEFNLVMKQQQPNRIGPPRGMRYVVEALRLEDFPMGRHEIDYSVGDVEIEDGNGGFVPIRELTDKLGDRMFRSAEEVIKALREERHPRRKRAA